MKTIFCVMRSGGKYSHHHVLSLKRQVQQVMTEPYRFVCLTDNVIDGCDVINLHHNWPGWWAKIELFRLPVTGPCLYLDLDTIIWGPISHLFHQGPKIMMAPDGQFDDQPNSSVMAWSDSHRKIYDEFKNDVLGNVHRYNIGKYVGDQSFVMDNGKWELYGPDAGILSYKSDIEKRGHPPPCGTSVIMFHGRKKSWDEKMPKWCHGVYGDDEISRLRTRI